VKEVEGRGKKWKVSEKRSGRMKKNVTRHNNSLELSDGSF
jgi:hypothetical protein